jgi:hypothetical protein
MHEMQPPGGHPAAYRPRSQPCRPQPRPGHNAVLLRRERRNPVIERFRSSLTTVCGANLDRFGHERHDRGPDVPA